MILSAQSIRKRSGMIDPFCERNYAFGLSYGLGPASYDFRIAEDVIIPAGGFIKASSLERFDIPYDLLPEMKDKSTWARRGVSVFNTMFDPGFRGFATIEIANHGKYEIEFKSGMAIAQLIFHVLDEATDSPYNGKFQDQPRGPQ